MEKRYTEEQITSSANCDRLETTQESHGHRRGSTRASALSLQNFPSCLDPQCQSSGGACSEPSRRINTTLPDFSFPCNGSSMDSMRVCALAGESL